MRFLVFILAVFLSACATYQKKAVQARKHLSEGRAEEAVKILEPMALKDGDDQLVYILDYAISLQAAGRFEDSNKAFLKAADIAEVKDYHSLSRVAGSLLLNEGMVQYKGEDYEKLLIHVYLAMNYIMMDHMEDALVEIRRLDNKLFKYKTEAKREYEQNSFARYLSALIWESDRKWDDAYIDYKKTHQLRPGMSLLREDLLRSSIIAGRHEEKQKWLKEFPDTKVGNWWRDPQYGEIILLYQQGKAPIKKPHPNSFRFPKLYPVRTDTRLARMEVEGTGTVNTESVYSVEDVAIKTLDDAYAGLVAKRVGGIVAKEIAAEQIRKKNELLGLVAWVGLHLSDQADLRQWSTLPETFQVARFPVKAGEYKVKIVGVSGALAPSGERLPERVVVVKPGKKTFLFWRSFN